MNAPSSCLPTHQRQGDNPNRPWVARRLPMLVARRSRRKYVGTDKGTRHSSARIFRESHERSPSQSTTSGRILVSRRSTNACLRHHANRQDRSGWPNMDDASTANGKRYPTGYCGWFCHVRLTVAVQGLNITKHFVLLRAIPTHIRCLATIVSAAGDKLALTGSRQR